ncbi:MAG: hypothetical protein JXD23_00935 [Spirochaetales bacterium]|nr:hypothetical protein [Spirochaetales bacterium]
MKRRRFRLVLCFFSAATLLFVLAGCEQFLGNGETPNVTLDIGQIFGDGRAIVPPYGIAFTEIVVTVYGEGMTTIRKTVSPGTRYINMYVPAGPARRFKIEAFFNITNPGVFPYHHLRSFIGRAKADLLPGRIVRLVFNMAAGSTMYLVPDYLNGCIFFSNNIDSLNSDTATNLNATLPFQPMDIEISDNGTIFAANYTSTPTSTGINYATNTDGLGSGPALAGGIQVLALAMDRDAGEDIDQNGSIDTSILYFTTGSALYFKVVDSLPGPSQRMMELGGTINTIWGLAVDPWTHLLYIACVYNKAPAIVIYNPFAKNPDGAGGTLYGETVSYKTDPRFRMLFDVTVTDTAVYVLNGDLSVTGVPSIIEFDRNLNSIRDFGNLSWDGSTIVPSNEPGKFYFPIRFIAQENAGLTILDDSGQTDLSGKTDFDKIIHINENLDSSSWTTFPQPQQDISGYTNDFFRFYVDIPS